MPFSPEIILHTEDLNNIRQMLEQKKLGAMKVWVVDDGVRYVVRDCNRNLIGYVSKHVVYEDTGV